MIIIGRSPKRTSLRLMPALFGEISSFVEEEDGDWARAAMPTR